MIINTDTLIRLLSNMTLFCGPKTQTGGVIQFSTFYETVVATASDDYVIIQQTEKIEPIDVGEEFFLPHGDTKKLIKSIEETWEEDTISFTGHGLRVENPNPKLWKAVLKVPGERYGDESYQYAKPTAIRPERFAKFSRLKADGDYPVDFLYDESKALNNRPVLRFRFGPTIIGVLSPIMRSVVEDAFADEEGVLWEE